MKISKNYNCNVTVKKMKKDIESYRKIILHISKIMRLSKLRENVGINLKFLFKMFFLVLLSIF
jgi:hypothetical protein